MRCATCQELWQRRLDDPSADAEAALDRHLHDCSLCARWGDGLRRVTEVLRRLPEPPRPPAGLAGQITRSILADRATRRRVRVRWAVSAALAASLLLASTLLFLATRNKEKPETNVSQISTPTTPVAPEVSVATPQNEESSVQATRDVLVAMLDRARKETDDQVTMLRPVVAPTVFQGPVRPAEAAESPLNEAGQGVVHGFEPVSGSARRAVGLFLRDLSPTGVDEKQGL